MADIVWVPVPLVRDPRRPLHNVSAVQHGYRADSPDVQRCATRVICSCGYHSEGFDDLNRTTNTHTLNLLCAHRAAHRAVGT